MATEELKTRTGQIQLENGQDVDGNKKYVSASIANLSSNASDWDADKYLNIVDALGPCLNKTIAGALTTTTYVVSASS